MNKWKHFFKKIEEFRQNPNRLIIVREGRSHYTLTRKCELRTNIASAEISNEKMEFEVVDLVAVLLFILMLFSVIHKIRQILNHIF